MEKVELVQAVMNVAMNELITSMDDVVQIEYVVHALKLQMLVNHAKHVLHPK